MASYIFFKLNNYIKICQLLKIPICTKHFWGAEVIIERDVYGNIVR